MKYPLFMTSLFLFSIRIAHAQEIPLQIAIGEKGVKNYIDYIVGVFSLAVAAAAILAVLNIMYAGIQWILAAGNAGKIKSARDRISNAILGLVLMLLAVTILSTLNQSLANPTISSIVGPKEFRATTPSEYKGVLGIAISGDDIKNYPEYVGAVYNFGLAIVGIIAVVMIIAGGIQWTTSFGNPTKIDSARKRIGAGIIGLVLLLGSYLILNTINPNIIASLGKKVSLDTPAAYSERQRCCRITTGSKVEYSQYFGNKNCEDFGYKTETNLALCGILGPNQGCCVSTEKNSISCLVKDKATCDASVQRDNNGKIIGQSSFYPNTKCDQVEGCSLLEYGATCKNNGDCKSGKCSPVYKQGEFATNVMNDTGEKRCSTEDYVCEGKSYALPRQACTDRIGALATPCCPPNYSCNYPGNSSWTLNPLQAARGLKYCQTDTDKVPSE